MRTMARRLNARRTGSRGSATARLLAGAGLVALLKPFVAWYLGIGIIEALLLDVSLAAFYIVYAFIFNWAYDRVFPIPVSRES